MRIESINLSGQAYASMDLGAPPLPLDEALQLGHFGKCVVIAGKNGSGKSRLLRLLKDFAAMHLTQDSYRQTRSELSQNLQSRDAAEEKITRFSKIGLQEAEGSPQLERARREFNSFESEIKRLSRMLALSDALTIRGDGILKVVSFVPKSTRLEDPEDLREVDATQRAETFAAELDAERAQDGAPAYARSVMRAATQERGARVPRPGVDKHEAETKLLDLLAELLGDDVRFELSSNQNLKLEGLTDRYDTLLSEGQKVLFQLGCMLHAREASLTDCILMLDEPENHLHPAVLNEVIDRLQKILSEGQIWIATHSVPLIAHLVATDPECLWYAENGRFSRAGRAPGKVLNSLLGGHTGASRVNDLTLMASRYASFQLLRQCLLPPKTIGYEGKDPQLSQIQEVLRQLHTEDQPLTVLDFGAGKGRLLDAIADGANGQPLSGLVDYVGYERFGDEAEHCQKRCQDLYGTENKQHAFGSLDAILQARGEKFADVAIVCNVLHEVHPDEWLKEFGADSAMAMFVKDTGFILFVEDYAIPVGERAHEYGFLLLDEPELRILFGIGEDDIAQGRFSRNDHPKKKYEGRLIAHAVSASCLARLSEKSRRDAIRSLHNRSLDRLQDLLQVEHTSETSSALGRESALVTQLIANSALWLRRNS